MYAAPLYEYLIVPCFVEPWRSCYLFVYDIQDMEATTGCWVYILHSEDTAHMWYIFWGCTWYANFWHCTHGCWGGGTEVGYIFWGHNNVCMLLTVIFCAWEAECWLLLHNTSRYVYWCFFWMCICAMKWTPKISDILICKGPQIKKHCPKKTRACGRKAAEEQWMKEIGRPKKVIGPRNTKPWPKSEQLEQHGWRKKDTAAHVNMGDETFRRPNTIWASKKKNRSPWPKWEQFRKPWATNNFVAP